MSQEEKDARRIALLEKARFNKRTYMSEYSKEYFKRKKVRQKHKWRERIRLRAYQKLKSMHKKEYAFYIKMYKRKIYKKYGRVW